MDVINLHRDAREPITCIDMHTTGEPTRIVIKGYPDLSGTLLQQKRQAKSQHDHIRKRLMLEPAGHADMYGAILRPRTELTETGDAHIGVLFTHNEGYSTMCGHATIALGRFLVDTHDVSVFPQRNEIKCDPATKTATLNLHAPCGLVVVTVPVTDDLSRSDPSRPVSFICVPSFATGQDIAIEIPPGDRWPELQDRDHVKVGFCYGGAFTCLVSAKELGFNDGLRPPVRHEALNTATRKLKAIVNSDPRYQKYMKHPEEDDLSSLYTVMVQDKSIGRVLSGAEGAETGLCYFADQQIDRSPTGSAVAARIAFAVATGKLKMGQSWTYHTLVSNAKEGKGGFVGTAVEEVPELYLKESMLSTPIRVRVEGHAYYVGSHVFISEPEDPYGEGGFLFDRL
ncbi:putative proline racemase [Aaosphaeria arxii CBS 175.79]|uniref:trans-L-3-hydroxyproline dehydratase n=1 Tax=Aaosphaeria arxii CBS 175.79 TaxID=1450172 RepID=A0A6A5XUM7_9PLEO|nr:putative proline racemase [Aaosphaeria arxii CBS 175.79]KAF2016340.1 putative proline racemase [Aaosphaeria arxii CBS 175.79]